MCTPIFSILLTVREVPNSAVLTTSSLKSLLVQIRKTKESKSTKSTPDYIYKEHKFLYFFADLFYYCSKNSVETS